MWFRTNWVPAKSYYEQKVFLRLTHLSMFLQHSAQKRDSFRVQVKISSSLKNKFLNSHEVGGLEFYPWHFSLIIPYQR